jgi:hypothetical protein
MGHTSIRFLLIAALVTLAPACKTKDSNGLSSREVSALSEDVVDVMSIAFSVGEGAYFGDDVSPDDVIEDATAANGFVLTYDLPPAIRMDLGFGVGRVRLAVKEDGLYLEDPQAFRLATSDALEVEVVYELEYEGETLGSRATDLVFEAKLVASRRSELLPFVIQYVIDGDCYLGETYCRYTTWLVTAGAPYDRIADRSDAEGSIDDPDLPATYDLDIDYRSDGSYVAEGWVGCCRWFRETFH